MSDEETSIAVAAAAATQAGVDASAFDKEAVAAAIASVDAAGVASAIIVNPNDPTDRDVVLGEGAEDHKTNVLLQDIVRLHRILWKLHDKPPPTSAEEVEAMAQHIIGIMKNGKSYELAGLTEVPKPFMKSKGRFFSKDPETNEWKLLDDEEVQKAMIDIILADFQNDDLGNMAEEPYKDLKKWLSKQVEKKVASEYMPEGNDAILLRCDDYESEKMYEHQGGNKTIFSLASQLVSSHSTNPEKRVEAALMIMKGLDDVEMDFEGKRQELTTTKNSRFLIRTQRPDLSITWDIMDPASAAEFTVIFVFEVFLQKDIHIASNTAASTEPGALVVPNTSTEMPSNVVIAEPADHDVLFGRGGMTNSHPGNRRFRDIISLHRPDYIRAIKMDKPAVARKIVRSIRQGSPPGRFLKKNDDGSWVDVGDRVAAEKTSQGLRERTNSEKRQRSALREALRIRKQDLAEDAETPNKKAKTTEEIAAMNAAIAPTLNYVGTNLPVPLSLSMKDPNSIKTNVSRKKTGKDGILVIETLNTEGLPPNAVDEHGNILVTDYDILCGRGGLTNHHKGNKRFRDIVALHRPDYVRAPKIQKPSVARVIVRAIRNGDPPGRFLRKDEKNGLFVDIGDKKAAEKTSQALREKVTEERGYKVTQPPALGVLLPSPSTYLAFGEEEKESGVNEEKAAEEKGEGEEEAKGEEEEKIEAQAMSV